MDDSAQNDFLVKFQEQFSVANNTEIASKLVEKINEAEIENRRRLDQENPFAKHRTIFEAAHADFQGKNYATESITADLKSYFALAKECEAPSDKSFWEKSIYEIKDQEKRIAQSQQQSAGAGVAGNTKTDNGLLRGFKAKTKVTRHKQQQARMQEQLREKQKTSRGLLHDHWQKLLDESHAAWELKVIAEYRREFFKELEDWLKLLQQIADVAEQIGLELGRLLDLSQGSLSFSDVEELKRWAEYLSANEGVRKLCEMLGRMRHATRVKREELIQTTETFHAFEPDIHSCEEFVGVCIGSDIEHALAEEKALLADEETADLFYLKFAEKRLLQFDAQGMVSYENKRTKEKPDHASEEEKIGPMIVCVDTSASMHGTPEAIAKAITLTLANKAISQERNCYLINFSTRIETLDLSGHVSLPELIKFLKNSFHGGTDAMPAIKKALKIMERDNYKKSDLLLISDMVMPNLSEGLRAQIQSAKENKNKFFSLAIGDRLGEHGGTNLKGLFEKEWVYEPHMRNVRQLIDCADSIA